MAISMPTAPSNPAVLDSPGPTSRGVAAAGARPAAITVRNLWKVFGPKASHVLASPELAALGRRELLEKSGCTAAVRNINFDVKQGELFVIMGLSGSGKSTLLRCLTRLEEPTSGVVEFGGETILEAGPARLRELRRQKFSMVFQHFGLLPHRSVIDNVAYGLELRGSPKKQRQQRAQEVIKLVGLTGYETSYPSELSGGMQQRTGLARALASEPEVLFFDEPFSALDPLIRRDMQDEVIRLHRELGKTMVFITHDLSEALKLGDRIMIMRDGEMIQLGTGDELVGSPANDYVRDFVSDVRKDEVLTLRWIARPATADDLLDGPELDANQVVREAAGSVLSCDRPVRVVDQGRLLGVVGTKEILRLMVGDPVPA